MSIIDSIYETVGAFSIHVKDTKNCLLMRNGEIDTIAYIDKTGEMYCENVDCKIMSFRVKNLIKSTNGLSLKGIICFEFLDKHVYIKLEYLLEVNNLNPNFLKDEYEFIPKEMMSEIRGGLYEIEKELMESMETP